MKSEFEISDRQLIALKIWCTKLVSEYSRSRSQVLNNEDENHPTVDERGNLELGNATFYHRIVGERALEALGSLKALAEERNSLSDYDRWCLRREAAGFAKQLTSSWLLCENAGTYSPPPREFVSLLSREDGDHDWLNVVGMQYTGSMDFDRGGLAGSVGDEVLPFEGSEVTASSAGRRGANKRWSKDPGVARWKPILIEMWKDDGQNSFGSRDRCTEAFLSKYPQCRQELGENSEVDVFARARRWLRGQ